VTKPPSLKAAETDVTHC